MKLLVLTTGLALAGGLWPFGGDNDAPRPNDRISDLKARKLDLQATPAVMDSAQMARQQYRTFLELSEGSPEMQMEAMRRLADLSVAAAEDADMASLIQEQFVEEAVWLYGELLERNPDHELRDAILYQLARAKEFTGDNDGALAALDQLIADHPDSRLYDESQFRRGEVLFVAKRYREAEQAYAAVIAVGDSSSFYEQSLYKNGWAFFKLGLHDESLDSFLGLLDRRLADTDDPAAAIEAMSRPNRELVDDTFRVLSISFSYMDGADTLDDLLDRRGDMNYANLLYAGLGDLYLDKERFNDAAETYAAFVSRAPTHEAGPVLQQRVIEAYTLGRFPSLVLESKRDYVRLYGFDTAFWPDRDRADYPVVVTHIKEHLSDLAGYDHALAQEEGSVEAYERAAGWYRRYLDYFPEDPDSAQRSFLLAEIYEELGRYGESTDQFLDAAYAYGPHEQAAEAAYRAVLVARMHSAQLEGEIQVAWQQRVFEESLQFADNFPAHPEAAPVRAKVAEELFAAGDLERAVDVAGLVVTMQPPASEELERTAWRVIAHSQFDLGRYPQAEVAYMRLRLLPQETPEHSQEVEARIAASIYRQGEQARDAGDVDEAVAQFLRVGDAVPGSDIVPTAIYDAGTLLITAERWDEAAPVLERFRTEFPEHEFGDEVTQKLAVTRREAGEAGAAAAEFERVAVLASVEPDAQREALWESADLYEQAGRPADERRVYAAIVERFPAPLAESIEARQKLADLAGDAGDTQDRWRWLDSIIVADAQAGAERSSRTMTLAARASLERAMPLRDAFNGVSLTVPLKDSMNIKKERMERALTAFGGAADYGVDEVVTAATYEIAQLYFNLSRELMDSERPAGLDELELEQYELLLEEQAFPIEEQAIDIYASNASRAATGVYDQWVRLSFERLAELVPARYAKPERSENLVAQLD
ncbi:MAG: tetratricopeptide repeat protein [Chromatiales bacterium]|nr:MAG: tetratricopeptide repeat protein [Chromatiales bacterium]